jgi:mycoredoxin-dependent peroxiredoxin
MGSVDTRGVKRASVESGDVAPDFDLPALIAGVKKRFRLSDERGRKNVVLAFYPFNWETASEQQFSRYQVERGTMQSLNTETVGICVDSIMNTTVWEREIGPFDFPLCSDFWPHGEVAEKYGVLQLNGPLAGAASRVIFVIDKQGVIILRKSYRRDEVPDAEEILEALRGLEQ